MVGNELEGYFSLRLPRKPLKANKKRPIRVLSDRNLWQVMRPLTKKTGFLDC